MFSKVLVLAVAALCVHADQDELSWRPSCARKPSGTLLPNPNDCSTYYNCANGLAVRQSCADGLLYNARTRACDWPENVRCLRPRNADDDVEQLEEQVQRLEEQPTEIEETVEISSEQTASWMRIYCPYLSWTILIPNLWDCSTFWMCGDGSARLMDCPAGLQYNRIKRICDYPENAKCTPRKTH